jgi:hypothetical protein
VWMYVRTHSTFSALSVYFDGVNVCCIALHIACTTCRRHAIIITKQHSTHLDHRQENGHVMYKNFPFVCMLRSLAHGISHECPARCPTHARCTILSIPLNMQCMCPASPPARRERHVCTTLLQHRTTRGAQLPACSPAQQHGASHRAGLGDVRAPGRPRVRPVRRAQLPPSP